MALLQSRNKRYTSTDNLITFKVTCTLDYFIAKLIDIFEITSHTPLTARFPDTNQSEEGKICRCRSFPATNTSWPSLWIKAKLASVNFWLACTLLRRDTSVTSKMASNLTPPPAINSFMLSCVMSTGRVIVGKVGIGWLVLRLQVISSLSGGIRDSNIHTDALRMSAIEHHSMAEAVRFKYISRAPLHEALSPISAGVPGIDATAVMRVEDLDS